MSSVAFSNTLQGSSLANLTNMNGFIYLWLSQLYFNDLNSSLCAAKGFALFGLQLGSGISYPRSLKNKAIKSESHSDCAAHVHARCEREWLLTGHQGNLFQCSMCTVFLSLSLVHSPYIAPAHPVSNLLLDCSCILLHSQLFIILSPVTAG